MPHFEKDFEHQKYNLSEECLLLNTYKYLYI